jgi:hypothetical protein
LDGFDYLDADEEFRMNGETYGFWKGSTGLLTKHSQFPCVQIDLLPKEREDRGERGERGEEEQVTEHDDDGDQRRTEPEIIDAHGNYVCPEGFVRMIDVGENMHDKTLIQELKNNIIAALLQNTSSPGTKTQLLGSPTTTDGFNQHTLWVKMERNAADVEDIEDIVIKRQEKISNYVSGGTRYSYQLFVAAEAMKNAKVVDLVQHFMRHHTGNHPSRYGYHAIVRCYGWKPNKGLTQKVSPAWYKKGKLSKYPKTNSMFESTNVPNLYFAGALSHGRDYRKAAGGFIHGFRYNARVLHR